MHQPIIVIGHPDETYDHLPYVDCENNSLGIDYVGNAYNEEKLTRALEILSEIDLPFTINVAERTLTVSDSHEDWGRYVQMLHDKIVDAADKLLEIFHDKGYVYTYGIQGTMESAGKLLHWYFYFCGYFPFIQHAADIMEDLNNFKGKTLKILGAYDSHI